MGDCKNKGSVVWKFKQGMFVVETQSVELKEKKRMKIQEKERKGERKKEWSKKKGKC